MRTKRQKDKMVAALIPADLKEINSQDAPKQVKLPIKLISYD